MRQHTHPSTDDAQRGHTEDVAVIGMGCRLPGDVDSPAALWRLLLDGRDAVGEAPPDRRRLYPWDPPTEGAAGQGGFLRDVAGFDAAFFGVSGREADVLDPQHRLLLEVAWEALEHAGLPPDRMDGTPTGVFTGISYSDYMNRLAGHPLELEGSILTNGHCVAPGRLSYLLGLQGPCVALDTACSSSLVAVHMARQALCDGECDVALAGGVTLTFEPRITRSFARMGMLSPTGRCRTFDAEADGFVRGEGCGVVVLKRLADALLDGDRVLAVVRGSATNQDGSSEGLAAPSVTAQGSLYRQALDRSGIDPRDVCMIETHGTGTPVGDPVEFASLADVYGSGPDRCALTSVKTNLGHLEPAAGITGLIKSVLCLQHGSIPRNLHFNRWNPAFAAEGTRFFVPTRTVPWPRERGSRIAAVSSFGFSGTNAHVLLEEAPVTTASRRLPSPRRAEENTPEVFLVPAGSVQALPAAAIRLADWMDGDGADVPLRDIAHTLALRRSAGHGRLGVVASSRGELVASLRSFAGGTRQPTVVTGAVGAAVSRQPVWVFSGHGSQWTGMGRSLLKREPAFAAALTEADRLIAAQAGFSVLDIIQEGKPVLGCGTVQPVLFALQIALAATWRSHGVEPAAVIGHSMGEVAAAVVAGALSLADGVRVICLRSALLSRIAGSGSMASVGLDARAVQAELVQSVAETVSVAVHSSPDSTVVAGATPEVRRLAAAWEARGIAVLPIAVDVASHCPQVDPVLEELRTALAGLTPQHPEVAFYSTVTETGTPAFDADYWCDNLRRPVRFAQAVSAAAADRHLVYVEVSPHPVVTHSISRSAAGIVDGPVVLPTLRRDEDEQTTFRTQLAALHCAGVSVDWDRLYGEGHLADVPTVTFARQHHWADTAPPALPDTARPPLPGAHFEVPGRTVTHCWRADAGTDALPWLADHQVHGAPVFPGAGHYSLALSVACELFGAAPHEVEVSDVHFTELLRLDEHTDISTIVNMTAPDRAECEILACNEAGEWVRQADAVLRRPALLPQSRSSSITAMTQRHPLLLDTADLYGSLRRRGLEHGQAFTGITELRASRYNDSFWAKVDVPARACEPPLALPVHPVLVDMCAQLAIAALMNQDEQGLVLPVGMQSARILGDPAAAAYCHARVTAVTANDIVAHARLLDETGAVVLAIDGLRFSRRAAQDTPVADDWLLEIDWQQAPLTTPDRAPERGSWIVVGESDGSADALARALHTAGARTVVWDLPLDDTPLVAFRDALADRLASAPDVPRGVVVVCAPTGSGKPTEQSLRRTRRLLGAAQTIAVDDAATPRLYTVTRGARSVLPGHAVDIGQTSLRGLLRVVALEHPDTRATLVDCDQDAADFGEVARELLADEPDDEVALRGGNRYVARLGYAPTANAEHRASTACTVRFGVDGFRLKTGRPGDLGSLRLAADGRRSPEAGEVEVKVAAAGLNFRDVLTAMGLLPPDRDNRYPIGFECAGVVTAVGAGVEMPQIGDEVIAADLRGGAFGTFVTVPAGVVAPIPFGIDPIAAAALPTAFMTAWYALRYIGRLRAGERVLIHSATGGTGMAAVAVAHLLGAEVLATAGSEEKRRHLRASGVVSHVMDSRSLDFGEETREATGGEGVDVVLNSLSGAAIRTGLETLRPFGRFIELGVRDILADAPLGMLPLRHNVTLSTVDLIELQRIRPETFTAVLRGVLAEFAKGRLKPLHYTAYPLAAATDAFRTMAAADHIGKLVLTVPDRGNTTAVLPEADLTVRSGGAYIVTGGLRGLGLATAKWLAARGVGHLVLNGRTAASPEAAQTLGVLCATGTKVTVVLGDIAEPDTADRLVAAATTDGHRLRGVVHCAMALEDAVITNIEDDQLDRVWAPKVAGAWRLHHATCGFTLDWFTVFSSMASLLGNPGQGAYAAANSWLDGFAAWRSGQGLPTLAVNWGPWGEIGVATDFARRGYRTITTSQGLSALSTLLSQRRVQTAVIPGQPDTWIPSQGRRLPFFSRFFTHGTGDRTVHEPTRTPDIPAGIHSANRLREELTSLPAGPARSAALESHLADHVRTVLQLGSGTLDPQTPLKSLGFDSLLAIELRVRIESSFAVRLPADFVKRHPTLAALAVGLADHLDLDLAAT